MTPQKVIAVLRKADISIRTRKDSPYISGAEVSTDYNDRKVVQVRWSTGSSYLRSANPTARLLAAFRELLRAGLCARLAMPPGDWRHIDLYVTDGPAVEVRHEIDVSRAEILMLQEHSHRLQGEVEKYQRNIDALMAQVKPIQDTQDAARRKIDEIQSAIAEKEAGTPLCAPASPVPVTG